MRVLFLSPWFPYPHVNGSKIRIYHLLRSLAQKHEVSLISFVRRGEIIDTKGLDSICRSIKTVTWNGFSPRSFKSVIGFVLPAPRSIYDTYSHPMADMVHQAIRLEKPQAIIASQIDTAVYVDSPLDFPSIWDEVELGLLGKSQYDNPTRLSEIRKNINWAKVNHFVRKQVNIYDACTVVSEGEKRLLEQAVPDYQPVHMIPNGVDIDNLRPQIAQPEPGTLVFSGALTFHANYDAMDNFLREIFPLIQVRASDAKLKITGSYEDVDLSGLALNDHVILTGFLEDIRPTVARSWVSVVPLRLGGGTRIKILESMALGTPVIATAKAAEGLAVTHEKNILIANDAEGFANEVVRLMHQPGLREHLAEEGRRLVETRYAWKTIGEKFLDIVESVVQSKAKKQALKF